MEAAGAAATGRAGRRPPPALGGMLDSDSPATPVKAAASVLVVVALAGLATRMSWDAGWFVLLALIGAAIVVPWALGAGRQGGNGAPDGLSTTVLVAGLAIVAFLLGQLADALGAEGGSGSTLWTTLLFAAAAAYPGWVLGSPVCALLSSAALGGSFLSAVDLLFGIESVSTFRWMALILTVAYAAAAFVLLNGRERHALQHVSAAGLTLLAIAFTLYAEVIAGAISSAFAGSGSAGVSFNGPFGWELVVLLGSAALIAVAALRREPGPGYIGAFALSVSVGIAAIPDADVSLIGWPLLFVLLALAAVAAVLSGNDPTAGAPTAGRGPRRARATDDLAPRPGPEDGPPPPPPARPDPA